MTEIGAIIYKQRKELKLTAKELGALSSVSASHIGRVERGERYPSAWILRKLAAPLKITEVELLKLAGYLSRNEADERLERARRELSLEVTKLIPKIQAKIIEILS